MPSLRQLSFALLVATAALAVAVPAESREPPQAVCGVCTDALDDAAADRGLALERASSAAEIRTADDGSARWTARVTLAAGADALENDSLRTAVVADALSRARSVVDDPRDVRSRIDGRTLVVSYRDPAAAESRAGALVLTRLYADGPSMPLAAGGEGPRYLGADELVVRAPDGYAVRGDYAGATANETAVRWVGDAAGDGESRAYVGDGSTAVSFVPDGALFPGARAALGRFLATF